MHNSQMDVSYESFIYYLHLQFAFEWVNQGHSKTIVSIVADH